VFTIDGSQGEGGGQVLRTTLSLSALTGQPFRIINIRGKRTRPGLRPQHLTATRAVAEICQAEVRGDAVDSLELEFKPGTKPQAGRYHFDVAQASPSGRSAGSVILVLQTVLWPLLIAQGSSEVTVRGGTFVPFSPPFHYFAQVAGKNYKRFGVRLEVAQKAWGWMADGKGEIEARIEPVSRLQAVSFEPVLEEQVNGIAVVTNLPSHIPHRMARRAINLLEAAGLKPGIEPLRERGVGPGAGITLWMSQAGFSALGRKGLPADKVAEEAVRELLSYLDNGAAVDYHLADQLLIPMALADGTSSFTVDRLSLHTLTNIQLLKKWLGVEVKVSGQLDGPGSVEIRGINLFGV